jgi:hypothetical protein
MIEVELKKQGWCREVIREPSWNCWVVGCLFKEWETVWKATRNTSFLKDTSNCKCKLPIKLPNKGAISPAESHILSMTSA